MALPKLRMVSTAPAVWAPVGVGEGIGSGGFGVAEGIKETRFAPALVLALVLQLSTLWSRELGRGRPPTRSSIVERRV